jgi:predicted nicotinamide N-methyase
VGRGVDGRPDLELVEEVVALRGRELVVRRPRSSEALLDEEAFEHEEYLPYWAELWPSALALARVVEGRSFRGARVVELGCGLAIPSIVAALGGARVLATDWSPDAVGLVGENAARNGAVLETAIVPWSDPAPLVARAPWDLVLASDVLYERRNVDLLLDLLPRLVDERGEVLLAEPGRPPAKAFLERAPEIFALDALEGPVPVYRLRAFPGAAGVGSVPA